MDLPTGIELARFKYIYIDAPRHEAHRRPPGALFTGIQGELDDESFVLRYQKVVLTLPVHYCREE